MRCAAPLHAGSQRTSPTVILCCIPWDTSGYWSKQDAITALKKARRLQPQSASILASLGAVKLSAGDKQARLLCAHESVHVMRGGAEFHRRWSRGLFPRSNVIVVIVKEWHGLFAHRVAARSTGSNQGFHDCAGAGAGQRGGPEVSWRGQKHPQPAQGVDAGLPLCAHAYMSAPITHDPSAAATLQESRTARCT